MLLSRKCFKCGYWLTFVPDYKHKVDGQSVNYPDIVCSNCRSTNRVGHNILYAEPVSKEQVSKEQRKEQ